MKKRGHFIIHGRVQGVCYRMYSCDEASRLGVCGWVRNNDDGTVEIVAEAEEKELTAFLDWCRRGPPYARVISIEENYSKATGEYNEFVTIG